MRSFYLHTLSFILSVLPVFVLSQTAAVPLVNSFAVVDNNDDAKMFHGHENQASCCGNQDPNNKVIVTYEVLNLTLTQSIIDELKGSTNDYNNGVNLETTSSMYSSGPGYDLLTWTTRVH